ncbi:uncharacterized protein LOC121736720 [Aricia agestis]|uniref:uncharacterized protein LOC121736720 n=1 Tax=Aricia agestis TaxID=91739 RepID=UPI001C20193F|nr:uncharacterized protein LOC121736720 [Aricia agestis]
MISLHKNQLAIWILLYILDYSTSFEYRTIWTNLNNKQLCGVPPSAPWKAWQRLYYDNSNKIISLKQLPYINGPRYGKVNITNFGNYETINNKHGAKSLRHDDRDQIIENTKENVLLSSRSKTFSLIGYDEEIYKIMQKFTMSEQTGPIVVYFYLSQNHTYSSIGLLRTTPRILDSILSKYNYFNCVNSNHIMIPRKNNIFYADECLKDCDRLVTNIKLKDNDDMESYVDCFANRCLNGKDNYQNNIVINNENSLNINDSPAKHSIDKYYSEKPSPIRDNPQHMHFESYYNPIPVREFMSHPSHLESNEFKLKASNNDNNFEIIKNNVDTQTTNTSPAENLNNAIILEGNFIKENFKPPEMNYDPSSNNKIDTYISYGKNKNLQQMYNTRDDQRAVDNIPYNINYKEDQNGQLVFPYKLTSSEIFDTALANNQIEYLPSQKLLKEKSLFPKQYLNSPSIAEAHYSIPRILPYSSIKSDIQKKSSAYPTNENIKHFNYAKPRLFPAYAQTFDSESLNSNPSLPYMYKPETGYNMQRYNLVETNESKASIAKLSAIPYELKSSHIPKLNQYNIVSEKSPDPSTLTYIHTPTALQRPGFYAQKDLQNLKVVPSQGLNSNTFKQNLQTLPLLAYKKPVPVINKKINSDYIPSVSYYTLYSFNKPHSVSPKDYSPTNFISPLKVNLKPWYETMQTTNKNPTKPKAITLDSSIVTLNSPKKPQHIFIKPRKLITTPSLNIPCNLVPIQLDKTYNPESNINEISMDGLSKSKSKYLPRCDDKLHLLQTPFSAKDDESLPRHTNKENTPSVKFTQWKPILLAKDFIEPNFPYNVANHKNKVTPFVTPSQEVYQTIPKTNDVIPLDVEYTTSKIPSFYDSHNPTKIISVLPKTGSTENYKTSVESQKLPFKKTFNPKKLNVIPHYQSILNKKAPTWVQKYQPVDGFPSQNVNQNLFTKNFKSNDNQERDPIIDLDKATTGIPQYKVFNAPNAKTTKYYCPSNRYPSFLNIQNDINSPTTTTTSFTSRNPTPHSQHSLFTEPQDKNNKVQSISNGIASPCHFPPLSQTSKTYKPQFSEKLKELTHQEAVSHTTEPQNKSNEEQSISNRIASSCYFPPLTQTSKTYKPQISEELTQQESIPRQNNQRNFKNLELPLASSTSYKNPSLYVPNYFNNIPPNPQLATLSTATYHPDTEIQNSPAVNFAQPLKILDEKEYFKSPNVEYYNPTSKFKAKPFITPLTPRVELLPPKRKNMDLLNAAYFPSKINTICNNTAFSETSKLSDIDDTNNYLASVEVPKVPPRISLNRDEIKNIKNTPSTHISQHTPSWIKKYYHYPLQTLHNLPIQINKQHIFEKPAIPMSHKETKLGQNRITESYDFPMSQILQSYRPQPLEVPKLSKQNDELTPQSKTKVTEFEPPQHQQPDFQNVTFSQANGSNYRIPPLNPYSLKSMLRNVQPARAPTATNQQSNLNFNQERNIKELHGNLYFQRNGQGLPNLANKGPVSSTPYIHKYPPFEFTNPMWTISPQTLSNNSLEPKQQIKFAPMKNSLEQIKWYKNIPCYASGDDYKIQNPKLNYVKPFDYETNGYYPKISKQKGLQPCVSNTAKFYDPLILNPHTTSSQTKPTNLALEPTRFSNPEKLWTPTLNHDLRTPEYFPTFSTTQIKYYTPPVTKNVNPIKQPLVCVNNNKINYYKKPINPSSIRKTIYFTPDYQQGINVENASRKVSPIVYQPQHPIHKNFTKLSTLHKPLQSYLEPEKSLASHYEMPKALVKFSSVAPTERIKYNIWPAKYSQNLSTRSPIPSSSNLQQNSPYSSRPSQNQENNINQINNIVKNQFVKEPVSYIQGRGRSNGHKYDTLRNDSPCSLLSVPIPMNSYSPSASIISKKSGIPKPYPKSTFNSKTKANPTLKLNTISTSAVAPIINKPKTQSYPYINQQSTQCVFNTLFEDLKDSSGNHRILTSAVAPFINITPSLEMQPNPYKYTPKLKNLKDSEGFRIPASAVTPITNIYSKIPSLKAWSNPYKYTPTFKYLKDSSANNRILTSAETPIIDITPSFKTKSNTYKYTPLEDLKNVKKKSVDHRIPTSAETPIIIIIPSFKTKLNPYKYATIEDLKDVAVDHKTRTNPYKYAPFEDLKDSGSAHGIPASAVAPFINLAPSLETRPNSYKYTPFEDFKDSGGNPRIPTLAVAPIINMTPSLKTRTNPYKYTPLEDLQDSGGNYRTPTLAVAPIINMIPSLKTRTSSYKYTLLEDLQDSGGNYRTPTLAVAPIINMTPSLKTRTNPYKYTPFEDLKDSGVLYHRITTSAVAPIINITPSLNIRPNPYKYTPTYFKDQKDGGGNFIIPTSGVTPIMNMTPYKYTPFKDRKDSGGYHKIQTSAESPIINITPSLKTRTNPYKYSSFEDLVDSGGSHGIPVSSETPVTNIAPFLKTRSNPYKYTPVKDHKDISSANHRISASANTSIMKKVPSLKTRPNPYKYTPTYFKDEKYGGGDLRIPTSGVTPIINMTPYKYTPFKDRKDSGDHYRIQTSAESPIKNIIPSLKTRSNTFKYTPFEDPKNIDKFYESRAGFTNGKISIPFRDMGLAKYEITKPNEYFVKTEIPGLFIKAWGSRIKIIRPRLVLDVKEYEGYNFMPVIKNHYYSPEFAQNVAKDIVTRLYGEPIVIDGVYRPTSPYAVKRHCLIAL